jgi:hypothetical protein
MPEEATLEERIKTTLCYLMPPHRRVAAPLSTNLDVPPDEQAMSFASSVEPTGT